jgi:hypothetical protein
MMEWLLRQRFAGQIDGGGRFVQDLSGIRYEPAAIYSVWSAVAGFINRIPAFVWQDYGKRQRIELPEPQPPVPPPPPASSPTAPLERSSSP